MIQYIVKSKQKEQNLSQKIETDGKVLFVQRILGHKEDIPGTAQWKIFTNYDFHMNPDHKGKHEAVDEECFVCDKDVYSVVFWNELIGAVEISKYTKKDQAVFLEKLHEINGDEIMRPLE